MTRKYAPLAPAGTPGIWANVINMLPCRSGAYAPGHLFTQKVGAGPASPGTTLRAWCALLADDTAIGYIGTSTKLYVYDGTSTFTDRSAAAYAASDWSFAEYGNITFAVDRVDAVQTRDATGVANFANATGSPPKASIVLTQSDQVLLFDLNDGAEKPDAFAACAPGDHTDWSGAGATTATRIRHRPGKITAAIAFRDYVLVFKRSSIYRLTYTGNNTFKWKVELIAIGRGAYGKHDVVNCGDVVVFSGPGGAWTYDGASFRSIADFGNNLSVASSASFFLPSSQRVYFHVPGRYVAYNISSDAWGVHNITSTTGELISGSHRPFTGEPAALSTFAGSGETYPDLTWIVDLSLNPCVMKQDSAWGNGASSIAVARLVGTLEGKGGDTIMRATRLNLNFAAPYALGAQSTPPTATELKLDVSGLNSSLDLNTAPLAAQSDVLSSTAMRRFDIDCSGIYILPVIKIPADSGYVEIDDYELVMAPAGRL